MRESNPRRLIGSQVYYHYNNDAYRPHLELNQDLPVNSRVH